MRRALLIAICILSLSACSLKTLAATEYRIIDLGSDTRVYGINNKNQVVGAMQTANGWRAFIWDSDNGTQEIPSIGGGYSYAAGINDAGQVLGSFQDTNGEYKEFIWDSTQGMRVWEHPGLGTPDMLAGINNLGQIAGLTYDLGPFLWNGDGEIQSLGAEYFDHIAFNNRGQIVGAYMGSSTGTCSYVWDATNGVKNIPQDANQSIFAEDINDKGQAAGTVSVCLEEGWVSRGFAWDSAGMVTFDAPGSTNTYAHALNNTGDVVGGYDVAGDGRIPYIWNAESGTSVLPTLNNARAEACLINNNGWITGYMSDGIQQRAVIWQPVPEPSSLLAVGMGLAAICLLRRR